MRGKQIVVPPDVYEKLSALKVHPREPFGAVIKRLIDHYERSVRIGQTRSQPTPTETSRAEPTDTDRARSTGIERSQPQPTPTDQSQPGGARSDLDEIKRRLAELERQLAEIKRRLAEPSGGIPCAEPTPSSRAHEVQSLDPQLPDFLRDNPWLSVIAQRQ
jgi:predicted CopG family antitoxin